MRRGLLFTFILILFSTGPDPAIGQQTPEKEIYRLAAAWLYGHSPLKSIPVAEALYSYPSASGSAVFAVTFSPAGFVILRDDSNGPSILGWSESSSFPDDPSHPLLSWLIPSYAKGHDQKTTPGILPKLKSSTSTDDAVAPLIPAQWGQGNPWNSYCPADSTGKRALAGCVAVAMAQVMDYWDWPEQPTGTVVYTPLSHPDYGELRVNLETAHYAWDSTHPVYPSEMASRVLYHAGVATRMNYGPTESGTSVDGYALEALKNNFRFQKGIIYRNKEEMDYASWIRMMKQELVNRRPVIYSGTSLDRKVSHAFNIDGFRSDDYFHFNWGWNGAGDGWYNLSTMGGGSANFSLNQGAIFGLQPDTLPLHDRPSKLEILPGDRFVRLFWEEPVMADLSHYSIYRNGDLIGITTDREYTDEDLENEQEYKYEVSASYVGQSTGESLPTPSVRTSPWEALEPGYQQTFEAGLKGWQLQGDNTGFIIGAASELGFGANSGHIAAIRSEGLPSGSRAADYLTSPIIYSSRFKHLAISFDYSYKQNPGSDMFFLMYRDFLTGVWQPLARMDSTGGRNDWKTFHIYLPAPASNSPIQIAFYYNDFYGDAYGAAVDNIRIYDVEEPAVPNFSASFTDICQDQLITFTDLSTGPVSSWEWDFGPDANPRYATTKGPHEVSYSSPGKKKVKLSLNHLDHKTEKDYLSVRFKPEAAFSYSRLAMTITFTSRATNAPTLLWLFGDGNSSTETNPVHTYITKELFEVRQIAYNGTCPPDTLTISLDLRPGSGIDDPEEVNGLIIWPNPTSGKISYSLLESSASPVSIRIHSITGREMLYNTSVAAQTGQIDLTGFPEGLYILQVTCGEHNYLRRIAKTN